MSSSEYADWHPAQAVANAAERYADLVKNKRRNTRQPRLTPEQARLARAAQQLTCPADNALFRHLIDNSLTCARCREHATTILEGNTL